MKTSFKIFVAIMLLLPVVAFGQAAPAKKTIAKGAGSQNPAADCFHEWHSLLRERGAATVTDGTHDVVISLWSSITNASKCYLGRVMVSGGRITKPILIQKEDGTYEPFSTLGKSLDPAFTKNMTEEQLTSITDGMSVYFQLSEVEGGQIFFYTFVNAKPKGLKEAPSAKSLIKN